MEQPIRKTLWERHYTGYYIAGFSDGYHIVTWANFRRYDADAMPIEHIAESRKAAKAWCEEHSKKTTRAQHHQNAIDKAIAYLEKEGYKVIKL